MELSGSQYSIRALDFLISRPIFAASAFAAETGIRGTTAERMLKAFHDQGLLRQLRPAEGRKPAVLAFNGLLTIVEGSWF